jgi:hypothetical protein
MFIECHYIELQNKLRLVNNKVNIHFRVLKAVDGTMF